MSSIFNLFQPIKMVLIVRTDLKMSPGKIASQCAHAAVLLAQSSKTLTLRSWLLKGQPKIVLKIDKDCEDVLNQLHLTALKSNLNTCLVHDAGKTEVKNGTLTVLGIGPNRVEDVDKLTKGFKLL